MGTLEKVRTGQRFRPKAETWNAFVDAARYVKERRLNQGVDADRLPDDTILVRNASEFDVPQYGLLWLTGAPFKELRLAARPAHPFLTNVAIAAEPIAAGAVGHAWDEGQHPLRIANWDTLTDEDLPLLVISQSDSFDARAWTGTGTVPVIARLDEPLVLADLTNRSAS
jgi:hypothetical protein